MDQAHVERRRIAAHAAPSDFTPPARQLLWKLGYELLPADELPARLRPALRVVREERLDELPERAREPIILLTGRGEPEVRDPRVVGVVRRPAGLHELFRLIQSALEETPRTVPRVTTSLPARACSTDESWFGRDWELLVLSLSENGCLVTGPKLPPLDTALRLHIDLPDGPVLAVPAVASYELGPNLGLVFQGMQLATRRQLADTVTALLTRT